MASAKLNPARPDDLAVLAALELMEAWPHAPFEQIALALQREMSWLQTEVDKALMADAAQSVTH